MTGPAGGGDGAARAGTPPDTRPTARTGARVLIAEDEQHLGALLEHFLAGRGHVVARLRDGREALARLRAEPFDVAIVDVNMPGLDGLGVLKGARALALPPEVAVVTGHGTADTALEAMRLGAYDYVTKPYRMAEVETLVRRMLEKRALRREVEALRARVACAERGACAEFVTEYAPLRAVLALVDRAAPSDAPVLVDGQPGTGKALLAARIHLRSGRPAEAFVAVDCRDLARDPAAAADSLLGAGAAPGRPGGLFAGGEGGTIYLEHVDALPAEAQRRLVGQLGAEAGEGIVLPRVVASVAADPDEAAGVAGRLDPALRAALSRVRVTLPPLAARPGDVRPLVEHLVRLATVGAPGSVQVAASALEALEGRPWPGNVDELRAVVEAGVARARGGVVDLAALGLDGAPATRAGTDDGAAESAPGRTLAAAEREQIEDALAAARWHQGRAAEALGISARTLYRKIRAYGLSRPRVGAADAPRE